MDAGNNDDSNRTSSAAEAAAAAGVNWPGLASVGVFYALVLAVGIWAAWRQRRALRALGRSPTGGQASVYDYACICNWFFVTLLGYAKFLSEQLVTTSDCQT